MKAFARKGATYVATFTPDEAQLLQQLCLQIAELMGAHADYTNDTAVSRLLPDAYRDDDEAAAEFRRFTADDLAGRKAANARVVVDAVAEAAAGSAPAKVVVGALEAQAWIRSLTDIRLTLAARLGIETDDAPLPFGEPLVDAYLWLGYVQESLVRVLR
ncbi:MAG: hypothetical protein JWN80_2374 [Microbacteriaceae bacterium]|nr:hypothetical protein [Microbacteriaceae bacterium]